MAQNGGMCGMGCVFYNERERDASCIDCSHQVAKRHLDDLAKYKANITVAAEEKCFPAALLAAFISRQTKAGIELEEGPIPSDKTHGWLQCHNIHGHCYGLMHLPESELIRQTASSKTCFLAYGPKKSQTPITKDGVGGIDYLKQGIDELIRLIDLSVEHWDFWAEDLLTRAGIASYDAPGTVGNHEYIDSYTINQDFSSDILARAQFYAENGY